MANILFATNRKQEGADANGVPMFGHETLPANLDALICAAATVDQIDINKPSGGRIVGMTALSAGSFAAADLEPLIRSDNDILVFVHGAANDFSDAITRAAYNQTWLAAAGLRNVSSNYDFIAFTWPARAYDIPDVARDMHDYRKDQAAAVQSAYHFGLFLRQLVELRQRLGTRRLNLLCHSMGNFMLGGAVELLFSNNSAPAKPLFDEVVLAAADEQATTFCLPDGRRLANLWRLGHEITVYYNHDDVLMFASHIANFDGRLGFAGPPNKFDRRTFSPNVYEFVDCTGIDDFISTLTDAPDRSHQYYRQSPKVRADIAASLAGIVPTRPKFNEGLNEYLLFP
jgi:esterase/lipase superfamily enzyme